MYKTKEEIRAELKEEEAYLIKQYLEKQSEYIALLEKYVKIAKKLTSIK